jgi:hypothetical protein
LKRLLVTLLVVAVLLGVLVWWFLGRSVGSRRAGDGVRAAGGSARVEVPYQIYFPGADGLLHPERRTLSVVPDDLVTVVEAVVQSLLAGPEEDGHFRPWPEEVVLLGVVLSPEGTAYIDLGAEGEPDPPPAGSRQETAMVYSLVDSVTISALEVKSVVLLWNGEQRATVAGHLDASRPLGPRTDLLARRPEQP